MKANAMDRNKRLRFSRRLDAVPRWAVVPTIQKQNVAQHSYQVAQICRWLLDYHVWHDDTQKRLEVVEYALDHDLDEAATGDYPSNVKARKNGLDDQVKVVVKVADQLEALSFLYMEQTLGHATRMLQPIHNDIYARLHDYWILFEPRSGLKPILTMDLVRMCIEYNYEYGSKHPGMEEDLWSHE